MLSDRGMEILRSARERLDRGWAKTALFVYDEKYFRLGPEYARACAIGCVIAGAGYKPSHKLSAVSGGSPKSLYIQFVPNPDDREDTRQVLHELAQTVRTRIDWLKIMAEHVWQIDNCLLLEYNDRPTTTFEDVASVFDETIERCAKERQDNYITPLCENERVRETLDVVVAAAEAALAAPTPTTGDPTTGDPTTIDVAVPQRELVAA